MTKDFKQLAQQGLLGLPHMLIVGGFVSEVSHEFKFGFNNDVGSTEETIWDGGNLYSYLSSASVLKISSDSTDDTSGGAGARTVQIYGVDTDYALINETITLNGQTFVNSVNSYLRIFRMIIRTAGSGGQNAGIVYAGTGTVSSGVPANVFAQVMIGENQTYMAIYTIPAGKTAFFGMSFLSAFDTPGGTTAAATIRLVTRPLGEVFQGKDKIVLNNAVFVGPVEAHRKFTEKTDIEMRAKTNANTNAVSAELNFLMIDN